MKMGTRHLIAVEDKKGKLKIAQYGQWDGYFEGQGRRVLEFIADPLNLAMLEKALPNIRFFTKKDDRMLKKWDEIVQGKSPFDVLKDNPGVYAEKDKLIAYFQRFNSRDIGAKILQNVCMYDQGTPLDISDKISLTNSYEFGKNSLFCEYAYVLRMKDQVLEVYTGFNQDKLKEGARFPTVQEEVDKAFSYTDERWYGSNLLIEIPFADIQKLGPDIIVKNLIAMTKSDDAEEDE